MLPGFKRTFEGDSAITQLKNLLRAIVKYNPKMGYVQGMNFLVLTSFYHSCEAVAFSMFEILLNYYGGLDIFTDNLYAIYMHCEVVGFLILGIYSEIWLKMVN